MLSFIVYRQFIQPEIIPGLPFRWYGLMYLVAFAITYLFFRLEVKRRSLEISADDTSSLFFSIILGLLIGARIFATLLFSSDNYYWSHPHLIFWPFDEDMRLVGLAGMNYYGGLVGAVVGGAIYARRRRLDLVEIGDLLACGIPLGYTFGRFGNYINGELYGRITRQPWGTVFPHARQFPASETWVQEFADSIGMEISGAMVNLPRHPTQIYEAIFDGFLIWAIIYFILRKRRPFPGFLLGFYIASYGMVRFVIDYLRVSLTGEFLLSLGPGADEPWRFVSLLNFIPSQLYSLLMIAGAGFYLYRMRQRAACLKQEEAQPQKRRPSSRHLQKRIKGRK